MLRKLAIVALVAASTACTAPYASAAPLSANNPYRSFNISGVNYGSMKWEQTHGNSRSRSTAYGGARIFRRR
jgi:hypothetical protein